MNGIALLESEVPVEVAAEFRLAKRLHARGVGEREYRFLWSDRPRILPVRWEGRFRVVPWANADGRCPLPRTGWTWLQSVRDGLWVPYAGEPAVIAANLVLANGVWYPVRQGLRGIIALDGQNRPHAYVVCRETTRYYRVMTRCDRGPLLVDEEI